MAGEYVRLERVCAVLYDTLGWQKYSELADILGGKLIRLPRSNKLKAIVRYERRREYFDALPGPQAAKELDISYGYFRIMKHRKNMSK